MLQMGEVRISQEFRDAGELDGLMFVYSRGFGDGTFVLEAQSEIQYHFYFS